MGDNKIHLLVGQTNILFPSNKTKRQIKDDQSIKIST